METRIRIREYNDGDVEYICEKDYFKDTAKKLYCNPIALMLLPFLYFSDNRWRIIEMKLPLLPISVGSEPELSDEFTEGVFDNIEQAKKFIDGYIKFENNKRLLEYGEELSKETFQKYP